MSDEEKRASDQDTAIEQAFVAGTLPEEDRRPPEDVATIASLRAEVAALRTAQEEAIPDRILASAVWNYFALRTPTEVGDFHEKLMLIDQATPAILEAAGVGSIFTKAAHGWDVKYVDGGTVLLVQGVTIPEALASHGLQVVHPVKEVPQGIVEVEVPV